MVGRHRRRTKKTLILCEFPSHLLSGVEGSVRSSSDVYSPLVMKVRSRADSVISGASTPGGGVFNSLTERDLQQADEALSQVKGEVNGTH